MSPCHDTSDATKARAVVRLSSTYDLMCDLKTCTVSEAWWKSSDAHVQHRAACKMRGSPVQTTALKQGALHRHYCTVPCSCSLTLTCGSLQLMSLRPVCRYLVCKHKITATNLTRTLDPATTQPRLMTTLWRTPCRSARVGRLRGRQLLRRVHPRRRHRRPVLLPLPEYDLQRQLLPPKHAHLRLRHGRGLRPDRLLCAPRLSTTRTSAALSHCRLHPGNSTFAGVSAHTAHALRLPSMA